MFLPSGDCHRYSIGQTFDLCASWRTSAGRARQCDNPFPNLAAANLKTPPTIALSLTFQIAGRFNISNRDRSRPPTHLKPAQAYQTAPTHMADITPTRHKPAALTATRTIHAEASPLRNQTKRLLDCQTF